VLIFNHHNLNLILKSVAGRFNPLAMARQHGGYPGPEFRVHDTLGGRVGWYNVKRWLHTNHGGSHARSHYAQGSS
jgi:hypothetical protein